MPRTNIWTERFFALALFAALVALIALAALAAGCGPASDDDDDVDAGDNAEDDDNDPQAEGPYTLPDTGQTHLRHFLPFVDLAT